MQLHPAHVPLPQRSDGGSEQDVFHCFGNYLMTLGIVETVARFVLVFSMMGLG